MREYAQNLNNKTVSARPKCVLEETGKKQAFVHVVRRHCGGQTFISGRALKISKLCFLSGACERSSRDQTYRPQFCGSRTRSRVSGGGRGGGETSTTMQITDLITRYEHRGPRKLVIREASNLFCGRISRCSFGGWMTILLFRV